MGSRRRTVSPTVAARRSWVVFRGARRRAPTIRIGRYVTTRAMAAAAADKHEGNQQHDDYGDDSRHLHPPRCGGPRVAIAVASGGHRSPPRSNPTGSRHAQRACARFPSVLVSAQYGLSVVYRVPYGRGAEGRLSPVRSAGSLRAAPGTRVPGAMPPAVPAARGRFSMAPGTLWGLAAEGNHE